MRLAFIVPALRKFGPVVVAKDIIESIGDRVEGIDVLYFDNKTADIEIENCTTQHISFLGPSALNQYDVVHSHSLRPDIYTYVKKNRKNRTVTTAHNYVREELLYTYNKYVSRLFSGIWVQSWKNKDAVVFLSNHMKEYYEKHFFEPQRALVIPNGRNLEVPDVITHPLMGKLKALKQKYFVCGQCSILTKRKGTEQLIRLLHEMPTLAAVIVGEGPEYGNLVALSKELQVEERCLFTGFQSNPSSWMKEFDCYIMSSYSEGFGLVLLESGLLGVPALCTDIPIFRELFVENEVIFYAADNIADMARGISVVMMRKNDLAAKLKAVVEKKYSVANMANAYYNLYTTLCS